MFLFWISPPTITVCVYFKVEPTEIVYPSIKQVFNKPCKQTSARKVMSVAACCFRYWPNENSSLKSDCGKLEGHLKVTWRNEAVLPADPNHNTQSHSGT